MAACSGAAIAGVETLCRRHAQPRCVQVLPLRLQGQGGGENVAGAFLCEATTKLVDQKLVLLRSFFEPTPSEKGIQKYLYRGPL